MIQFPLQITCWNYWHELDAFLNMNSTSCFLHYFKWNVSSEACLSMHSYSLCSMHAFIWMYVPLKELQKVCIASTFGCMLYYASSFWSSRVHVRKQASVHTTPSLGENACFVPFLRIFFISNCKNVFTLGTFPSSVFVLTCYCEHSAWGFLHFKDDW